jgi:hypothetical protein
MKGLIKVLASVGAIVMTATVVALPDITAVRMPTAVQATHAANIHCVQRDAVRGQDRTSPHA